MPQAKNTRRDVLKGLAVGAGIVATGTVPEAAHAALPAASMSSISGAGDPWMLLAPVSSGEHLGFGWHAAKLVAGEGAWTLTLAHAELGLARIAICYRRDGAEGLASTQLLDLVLMDGGTGSQPTEESVGRVVMALSKVIARNELAVAEKFPHLMTHAERVARFGPESL